MSISILLDTGFLIALVNAKESEHSSAMKYFKYCVDHRIRMCLSPLVVAEFEQAMTTPPMLMQEVDILPFNFEHGRKAAAFNFTRLRETSKGASRAEIKVDVMLLAQAACEGISHVLTRDDGMPSLCDRLKKEGSADLVAVNIREGFREGNLAKVIPAPLYEGKPVAEKPAKKRKPKAE